MYLRYAFPRSTFDVFAIAIVFKNLSLFIIPFNV